MNALAHRLGIQITWQQPYDAIQDTVRTQTTSHAVHKLTPMYCPIPICSFQCATCSRKSWTRVAVVYTLKHLSILVAIFSFAMYSVMHPFPSNTRAQKISV